MECYLCKKPEGKGPRELRPYGPKGEMICAECCLGDPEREKVAAKQFEKQLDSSGPVAIMDGSNVGPYPLEHHPDGKKIKRAMERDGVN